MSELNTSLNINVGGNFTRRLSDNARGLERFSQNGQRQMGRLRRSTMKMSDGINRLGNRYTAVLTGAAAAGTVKMLVDLETQFNRLGIQANMSADEVSNLKKEMFDAANAPDIRIGVDELLKASSAIIEQTGDKGFVKENIRNIGLMIRATGTAGDAAGRMIAELQKNGQVMEDEVLRIIDTYNQQGKAGAFTLENIASMGPRLFSAYGAMRSPLSPEFNKELGAAMQVIRAGTGTSEQATTAFEAMLRTFGDLDKVKMLQSGGIQVFDQEELKKGNRELRPVTELMVDIIEATKGDVTKLSTIFDAEAMRSFNGLAKEFKQNGGIESIQKFMSIQGDGSQTLRDSARAAETASASVQSLKNAWQKFADENLAEHIKDIADAINSLEPEQLQEALNTAKQIAIVLAGIYAANKALRMGMAAGRFMKGGKRGATTGGVAGGLSAAAATPVWVVNMPGGGMTPGGGGPGGRSTGSKPSRRPGRFGLLRAAPNLKTIGMMGAGAVGTAGLATAGAGAAGYAAGSGLYSLIDETSFADKLGETIAKSLAFFGNENAKSAVASRSRLEIELRGDTPATVRSIESDDMDITLDLGLVNP